VLYIAGVGGEVATRSRMCLEVGGCEYMGMLLFYIMSMLIYLLTPWCRVLLKKLTGLQLVNKFPAFHGT